jgi:5,10-methylenetetrahydromethanopterin reductase
LDGCRYPIYFVGFGPRSLAFAGHHFDGVQLHTFITPEGLKRARAAVEEGAAKAGRDAKDIRICSVLATVLEPTREAHLKKLVGRMATYMQAPHYAEMLVDLNGWDPQVLEDFRAHPAVSSIPGAIDSVATLAQLEEIEKLIPQEWLSAAAAGSAEDCARRIAQELEYGADEVCIHGSTPDEFAPVIDAYRALKA